MYNKILMIFASILLMIGFNPATNAVESKAAVAKIKPKQITSRQELQRLIKSHRTNRFNRFILFDMMPMAGAGTEAVSAGIKSATTPISHSDTNIQVAGVDESDTVKVDDAGYIYQIYNNQVRIIKGFPVAELSAAATISFADSNFYTNGIYVQNGKLAVIGSTWQTLETPKPVTDDTPIVADDAPNRFYYGWWFWNHYSQTRVIIYDISDQLKPKQIRDVIVDGDYIDSRRIGDNLYFVSRTYPRYYMYGGAESSAKLTLANMLPTITDIQQTKKSRLLAISDVSYLPEFVEPDYVLASSINLARADQAVVTKAYLGAGEMIYASPQSLYLSASKYNFDTAPDKNITSTQIFKFAIQDGQIEFKAAGEVPGTVLNQFSMDELGDNFRIATTTHNWASGNDQSTNSLYVLNKNMKIVGTLENLAKGEQIYSVRFLGNRGYIVTFRLVDPLFVIDLSTPEKPVVLGELKIPGYSNYLHPYDENHLIGFGKDAAVYNSEKADSDQMWAGGSAFYQGLKVALFDVTDMTKPKELYSVTIGERGTDSPLLWNHKALYWDSERHLFGFPVELYELPQPFDPKQPWIYGFPVSQAAYIYHVTPETGFTLKAQLSQIPEDVTPIHIAGDGYEHAYWDWEATNWFVNRILRLDENLYTLSNNQINVYDLAAYQLQAELPLTK